MSEQASGAVREQMAGARRAALAAVTGCAIHPVHGNPFCGTCRDHGNPHPFHVAEERWRQRRTDEDATALARWEGDGGAIG